MPVSKESSNLQEEKVKLQVKSWSWSSKHRGRRWLRSAIDPSRVSQSRPMIKDVLDPMHIERQQAGRPLPWTTKSKNPILTTNHLLIHLPAALNMITILFPGSMRWWLIILDLLCTIVSRYPYHNQTQWSEMQLCCHGSCRSIWYNLSKHGIAWILIP